MQAEVHSGYITVHLSFVDDGTHSCRWVVGALDSTLRMIYTDKYTNAYLLVADTVFIYSNRGSSLPSKAGSIIRAAHAAPTLLWPSFAGGIRSWGFRGGKTSHMMLFKGTKA